MENTKAYKILEIKNYILEKTNGLDIPKNIIEKGIIFFTQEEYLQLSFEEIKKLIDEKIEELIEEKEMNNYEKEVRRLYKDTKEKYQVSKYEEIKEDKTVSNSYNNVKKVLLKKEDGKVLIAFKKPQNSYSEYELLGYRLAKALDIPCSEYILDFKNGISGYSISAVQDENHFRILTAYDLVQNEKTIKEIEVWRKNNKGVKLPDLREYQVKYTIDLVFEKISKYIKDEKTIDDLKTKYLTNLLHNIVVDNKDTNYHNMAFIHTKGINQLEVSPLFDNGLIGPDETRKDKIVIGVGEAKKTTVLNVLYKDYYKYIEKYSQKIKTLGTSQDISKVNELTQIVDDTLPRREASKYKQTLIKGISLIGIYENKVQKLIKKEEDELFSSAGIYSKTPEEREQKEKARQKVIEKRKKEKGNISFLQLLISLISAIAILRFFFR